MGGSPGHVKRVNKIEFHYLKGVDLAFIQTHELTIAIMKTFVFVSILAATFQVIHGHGGVWNYTIDGNFYHGYHTYYAYLEAPANIFVEQQVSTIKDACLFHTLLASSEIGKTSTHSTTPKTRI